MVAKTAGNPPPPVNVPAPVAAPASAPATVPAPTPVNMPPPPPAPIESQPRTCTTDEQPPSYESLFGEIKAAKAQSSGVLDFIGRFVGIIVASVGFLLSLGLIMALPVISLFFGIKYYGDCRIQKRIPQYLIIGGACGTARVLIGIYRQSIEVYRRHCGTEDGSKSCKKYEETISFFLLGWFICGNIWIYQNYIPNFSDPNNPKYCHKTLYLFAFWLTTGTHIAVGVVCCCGCCLVAFAAAD